MHPVCEPGEHEVLLGTGSVHKIQTDEVQRNQYAFRPVYYILRFSLLWQPESSPFLRKWIPRVMLLVYFLLLCNVIISPIWINQLTTTKYPKALIPMQLGSVLTPMVVYAFLALKYFKKDIFMLIALSEDKQRIKAARKRLTIFILIFFIVTACLTIIMGFLLYEFSVTVSAIDFQSASNPMAIFTLISIILWIVYFLVTVLVGNATIATLIFIVYWICSTWIVSLEHLYYITGKKETKLSDIIACHYNLRTGLQEQCQSIQAGLGLMVLLTLENFILHIYTLLVYDTSTYSVPIYRWILAFSGIQNFLFLVMIVIAFGAAARVTFKFQMYALYANDMATKFFMNSHENYEPYQEFIISITCSTYTTPGFRIFGLIVTNGTFISLLFSLLSFLLVVVEKLLQQNS